MFHHHRYQENEDMKVQTMNYMKFVFICIDCGAIKNKVVSTKEGFEFEL